MLRFGDLDRIACGSWRFLAAAAEAPTSPTAQQPIEHQQAISVVAVVPARNEEDVIGETLSTVLGQDSPGEFRAILVDDRSEDRTAAIAQQVAEQSEFAHRLTVLTVLGDRPCIVFGVRSCLLTFCVPVSP
ncbi:MAG: glycosyltransferase [Candidatus Atribacteria bacterium]|nr:MAG: glycosyltransferase [Candidatus Atribacteria bacterium]